MKRNKFSLSHTQLGTCKMGQLVPITWYEVLPGDTVQQATSMLVRLSPVVTPVMHQTVCRIHHWFVPNRIIWTNWENFITGGPNGLDATVHPTILLNTAPGVSSLADQLGCSAIRTGFNWNALPFRAYALIWNEFYRDQDLQTALVVSLGDGNDTTTNTALQNICWEKDYLTSSRPFENKGPGITLPVQFQETGTTNQNVTLNRLAGTANTAVQVTQTGTASDSIIASLDALSVRHQFAMLRYQEARAQYGSRYVEYLRYLGVRSSDARLQRPEYLGGGRQTIQFSEVLQTGVTSSGTGGGAGGVGQYGGHGISAVRSNRYRRFFEEHGIVMSLLSIRPRTVYNDSVGRKWLRGQGLAGLTGSKEDYWQKELQSIGQQGINSLEADAQNGTASIFGYQDRYDEYRRMESRVTGLFRTTLDTWHLGREFAAPSSLNSTFVSCVPSTRIFADTSSDDIYYMANHSVQARRMVMKNGAGGHVF